MHKELLYYFGGGLYKVRNVSVFMIIEELCSLVRKMTIVLKMSLLSLYDKSSVGRSQVCAARRR